MTMTITDILEQLGANLITLDEACTLARRIGYVIVINDHKRS